MSAPQQRGVQHDTVTAPTSTLMTIDGDTFRESEYADQLSIKGEAASDVSEVFQNRGKRVSFTGRLKNGQTAPRIGELLALTFSGGSVVTYAIEQVEKAGFGKATELQITAKKGDDETF